jgi:hypothetical protein
MVMNMLWRGGFPVSGPPPAFEAEQMRPGRVDVNWLRSQAGRAVKWIDPKIAHISRNDLPVAPVLIVLSRDSREQARSQLKLLSLTGMQVRANRRTVRAMASSIFIDTASMQMRLSHVGTCHNMTFESILADPLKTAHKLGRIIRPTFGIELDVHTAASVVRRRSARCAPDLSVEMSYHA